MAWARPSCNSCKRTNWCPRGGTSEKTTATWLVAIRSYELVHLRSLQAVALSSHFGLIIAHRAHVRLQAPEYGGRRESGDDVTKLIAGHR